MTDTMTQSSVFLVGAMRSIDGQEVFNNLSNTLHQAEKQGIYPRTLSIDPLSTDWHSPLQTDHFRSGCSPIEALEAAYQLVASGQEHLIAICGIDLLRTGYTREQRHRSMMIYGEHHPLTECYDQLAQYYCEQNSIEPRSFKQYATLIFENYKRRFINKHPNAELPTARWYEPLTPLFRGVDCANPMIDFEGSLLIASAELTSQLDNADQPIVIKGVATASLGADGPDAIPEISPFSHLTQAYQDCCDMAGAKFSTALASGTGALDLYSCYPIIPLATLQKTELMGNQPLEQFIQKYPITLTGGMNLARAPWNNPALNGLICAYQTLIEPSEEITEVLVQGNGGLGYKQGFAWLSAAL